MMESNANSLKDKRRDMPHQTKNFTVLHAITQFRNDKIIQQNIIIIN